MSNPDNRPFTGQYQEWCRLQLEFAHHDIWWVKGQQIKAGNLTLLLLAAVIATRQLLWKENAFVPAAAPIVLGGIGGIVAGLGSAYVWSLYATLVKSRKRANTIIAAVHDPDRLLSPCPQPGRHWVFPTLISLVHSVAWGVTLAYFGANIALVILLPLLLWAGAFGVMRLGPQGE